MNDYQKLKVFEWYYLKNKYRSEIAQDISISY